MNRIALILIQLFTSLVLQATVSNNVSYTLITSDSIEIHSIPYSNYGSMGITIVNDLKNSDITDTIARYFKPNECTVSDDGKWIIEYDMGSISFYNNGKIVKTYLQEELIQEPTDTFQLVKFPDGKEFETSSSAWIIESFIVDDYFYALLADKQLARISLSNIKKASPIALGVIQFSQFDSLRTLTHKSQIHYSELELPDKEMVEKNTESISEKIEQDIQPDLNISFTVLFTNCTPTLLNYYESEHYSIYLFGSENDVIDPLNFRYYFQVKEIVENETNWNCKLKFDNWVFSYRIYGGDK